MSKNSEKVLQLLEDGVSVSDLLHLESDKHKLMEDVTSIRLSGYQLDYYTANDRLLLKAVLNKESPYKKVLSFNATNRRFSTIVISDTHIRDHHDFTYYGIMGKYAKSKDIHTILHLGDILEQQNDSRKNFKEQKHYSEKELEYMLNNHPRFKDTSIIYITGNHDDRLLKSGNDITESLLRTRLDFVPLGVGNGIIKLNNRVIALDHPNTFIKSDFQNELLLNHYKNYDIDLILRGHLHKQKSYYYDDTLVFQTAPFLRKDSTLPSFYIFDFQVEEACISAFKVTTCLIVDDKVYKANETEYYFKKNKGISDGNKEKTLIKQ